MKASQLQPGQFPQGTEARVCQDIAERQALGVSKYGTTVERNPLCLLEWLEHAYQECLDQAVYLKRAMEEMQRNENATGFATPLAVDGWEDEPQPAVKYKLPDGFIAYDGSGKPNLPDDTEVEFCLRSDKGKPTDVTTVGGLGWSWDDEDYSPDGDVIGYRVIAPPKLQLREGVACIGYECEASQRMDKASQDFWKTVEEESSRQSEHNGRAWAKLSDVEDALSRIVITIKPLAEVPPPVHLPTWTKELDAYGNPLLSDEVPPSVEPAAEPAKSPLACESMDPCDCMIRQWVGKCPHVKVDYTTVNADLAEKLNEFMAEHKQELLEAMSRHETTRRDADALPTPKPELTWTEIVGVDGE